MIKFELDVNVTIEGMDDLIAAISGDISDADKQALNLTLLRLMRLTRRLERLDAQTPAVAST